MSLHRVGLAALLGLVSLTALSLPAQAEWTPADDRGAAWDYQPAQGPRPPQRERDYFSSEQKDETPIRSLSTEPVKSDWVPPAKQEPTPRQTHSPSHPTMALDTQSGIDVGGQISGYHYHEPTLNVKLNGPQFGLTAAITHVLGQDWFARLDTRFAGGPVHYTGSGESDDPNIIAELRATAGHDFRIGRFGVSPYLGLGYRHVNNDARGVTTTGASGYRRGSHYLFVPVGAETRTFLSNGHKLSFLAEIDPLLQGWQTSKLSDVSSDYPDITNNQRFGLGLRTHFMYGIRAWSFGPYLNYWGINKSTTDCASTNVYIVCGTEPTNHTIEYGLQLRYSFDSY
ncbi:MAG: hypothetical protein EOM37_04920 [Proteobacteria bacterium]|nr:hypothetical protein [Pseudomonadota bacterium]